MSVPTPTASGSGWPTSLTAAASLQLLDALLGSCPFEEARRRLEARKLVVRDSKWRPDLYTVSYNDIRADFSDPLARLARGLVLHKGTNAVVGFPFVKFFNAGERFAHDAHNVPSADAFRWGDGCVVTEKIDGSLMKVYCWQEEWVVATNRTIDARDATLRNTDGTTTTFATLFDEAVLATTGLPSLPFAQMDPRCTYLFELTHPAINTVVTHAHPRLTHLGTRLARPPDYPELPLWPCLDGPTAAAAAHRVLGVPVPTLHPHLAASLSTVQSAAAALTSAMTAEGYVACDAAFRRLKVKSPAYVAAHTSLPLGDGACSDDALVGAVVSGVADDLVAMRPLLEERVRDVAAAVERALSAWRGALVQLQSACPPEPDAKARRRAWEAEAQRIAGRKGGVPQCLTARFADAGPEEVAEAALFSVIKDRHTLLKANECCALIAFIMTPSPPPPAAVGGAAGGKVGSKAVGKGKGKAKGKAKNDF